MVVYEATTKQHFLKLARFAAKQDAGNLTLKSWRNMFPKAQANVIEFAKQQKPQLDIWVVEDEKGKIRLALSIEKRGSEYHPKETKILTHASLIADDTDYAADNTQYYEELHHHLFKVYPPQGYLVGEFWGNKKIVEWTKRFFGDNMQILRETEHPMFGKIYFYRISFTEEPK